jgi:predicted transcriptional regulator
MPRARSKTLTEREAQIMNILWLQHGATAEQVREAFPVDLHDSTVRTLLRILKAKKYVRHTVRGKSFVYYARVDQPKAQSKAVRNLLKLFFGGSAEALLLHLIDNEQITIVQLKDLMKSRGKVKQRRTTAR